MSVFSAPQKNVRPYVKKIHDRAMSVSKSFRENQKELLDLIQKMNHCKGFRDFECASLWDYCTNFLKLEDHQASSFIAIARKAAEIPEIKQAIDNGDVQFSKIRRIVPVINKENKNEWIEKAKTLPKRELEREVAKVSPQFATKESSKLVAAERVQFQCGLDEKDFQEFLRCQDLVCQKKQSVCDFEATLKEIVRFYKEKNDPVLKADRYFAKQAKKDGIRNDNETVTPAASDSSKRDELRVSLKVEESSVRLDDNAAQRGPGHAEKRHSFEGSQGMLFDQTIIYELQRRGWTRHLLN